MRFGKIGARKMMWSVNNLLPKGARWVEYLESTGTQWIDTKTLSSGKRFYTKFQFIEFLNQQVVAVFSSGDSAKIYQSSSAKVSCAFNSDWTTTGFSWNAGVFEITCDFSALTSSTVCNNTVVNLTYSSFTQAPSQIRIFGGKGHGGYNAKVRIWGSKIWDATTSTLVLDLCPIAIGNMGYMLDLVTGEYEQYGNQGEGEFVIGPTIAYPERERESKQLFGLIFHFDNYSTNNIFESDFALSYLKEAA